MTRPRRYREMLGARWREILAYAGLIWIVAGAVLLAPLFALPFYRGEAALSWSFAAPGLGLAVPGLWLWRRRPRHEAGPFRTSEGAATVVVGWTVPVLAAAVPFVFAARLPFTGAVFEAVSGWTTTGLSVLPDVEHAPRLVLLLRSLLQLAGGAGLAILMISVMRGPTGPGLTVAEGRGQQLVPQVARSARLVVRIYAGYVVLGVLALRAAGLGWFDAVNHAFTAVSTGGFSTRAASVGAFDRPAVEAVLLVLMLLGSTHFLTVYALLKGRARVALRSGELRLTALVLPAAFLVLLFAVGLPVYGAASRAVRVAVFESVSALTTTGFSVADAAPWPPVGWAVLVVLMLVGGGTGSTAGGIKQGRVRLLWRALTWELRAVFLPRGTANRPQVWEGDRRVPIHDADVRRVAAFVFLYLLALALSTFVLTAYGHALRDALFESASALGTVGLSSGVTRTGAPAGLLWTETAGMFLGRLEFVTVLVGVRRIAGDLAGWVRG